MMFLCWDRRGKVVMLRYLRWMMDGRIKSGEIHAFQGAEKAGRSCIALEL